jgi:hypothetical protein
MDFDEREHSREFSPKVKLIIDELERQNRTALVVALQDASSVEVSGSSLIAIYANDDVFAKRLRNSQTFFREVGEKLFKLPLSVEVKVRASAVTKSPGITPDNPAVKAAPSTRREDLEARALRNPAVRLAKERLRAEIIDVREIGEDPT